MTNSKRVNELIEWAESCDPTADMMPRLFADMCVLIAESDLEDVEAMIDGANKQTVAMLIQTLAGGAVMMFGAGAGLLPESATKDLFTDANHERSGRVAMARQLLEERPLTEAERRLLDATAWSNVDIWGLRERAAREQIDAMKNRRGVPKDD